MINEQNGKPKTLSVKQGAKVLAFESIVLSTLQRRRASDYIKSVVMIYCKELKIKS